MALSPEDEKLLCSILEAAPPRAPMYRFDPYTDLTANELAEIWFLGDLRFSAELFNKLSPAAARHFKPE